MPIKKDETGKRWVEMEFITPCTPEQVWRAIATGPGNTAWF
ncbi:MAG: SRPBCC domain-containing protein, partial [Mesorhizobium sp.]